jgi:hypothetical protein
MYLIDDTIDQRRIKPRIAHGAAKAFRFLIDIRISAGADGNPQHRSYRQ